MNRTLYCLLLSLLLLTFHNERARGAADETAREDSRYFSRFAFHYLGEQEGLPDGWINKMLVDSDGYLWIATRRGLVRYDGYRCLLTDTQSEGARLKDDLVTSLCEDGFGRMWIASQGGLDVMDLRTHTNLPLPAPADSPLHKLADEPIQAIHTDSQGRLYIATGSSLHCLEADSRGELTRHWRLAPDCQSAVRALTTLPDGTVCAGIDHQVCSLQRLADGRMTARPLAAALPSFSPDWRIRCMKQQGDTLWIGTNRGLFGYDYRRGNLKRYRYSTHRPGMLSQAYITDLALMADGSLIAATLNGLNVYHRETDSFSYIRRRADGLNSSALTCLLTTDGQTLCVGTQEAGADLLTPKRMEARLWQPLSKEGEDAAIQTDGVAEDRRGNLYLAMAEQGLLRCDDGLNVVEQYRFHPDDARTISNNSLTGLLADGQDTLWAYTWGVGINALDMQRPGERAFRRFTREEMPSLEGDFIKSACDDRTGGGVWFGATRGLYFYDKHIGKLRLIRLQGTTGDLEAISTLMADNRRRLWIGTPQGLYIASLLGFGRESKELPCQALLHKLDNPRDRRTEKVNALWQCSDGEIYIATGSNGLYRLQEKDGKGQTFHNFSAQDGLPSNNVTGMTEDGSGNLWLVTGMGVVRMNRPQGTFSSYTTDDGLPDAPQLRGAIGYSPRRKALWLTTNKGLLFLYPDTARRHHEAQTVKFASLTTAGITTASPARISLHEGHSRFAVGLTTLQYADSRRVRFAYRLKGYEQEWNETAPGDATAHYDFVPAGHYTLQARATDETGQWMEETTGIEVHVAPYFYKAPWFYLLLATLLGVTGFLFYRRKTRTYREQRVRLELEVAQRTQELAQRNRQLEQMAEHVREVTEEKIAFFTNITHELRTPITLIHGPIAHALKEMDDGPLHEQLQMAEQNARQLMDLVNELMDFRKIDTGKMTPDMAPLDFPAFLEGLLMPFQAYASERHIRIRPFFRLPAEKLMMDAALMRKAMVNLLSNALKFTPDGGRIDLFAVALPQGGKLYINVRDTGQGIVPGEAEKIFERFYQSAGNRQAKGDYRHPAGTGIGLYLCRKIVEMHDGDIWAQSNPDRGASFRILMPLLTEEKGEEGAPTVAGASTLARPQGTPSAEKEEEALSAKRRNDTILIVEDNPDMRRYLVSLLSSEYRLWEASNGKEALQMIHEHPVDLVISDLMMPGMDGMELSRRIKQNLSTSHIPLLMITALQSDEQEKQSLETGVDEFLCKPFDEELLLLRIRNILETRRRYQRHFSTSATVGELPLKEDNKDRNFVDAAIRLMEQNYGKEDYNLDLFARDMGYSKTLINKKLQALTGQTTGQFMKSFRLNVARRMMEEAKGGFNVSEIAYAVGFADPKYFTKCFKELFGCLPSDLLKG